MQLFDDVQGNDTGPALHSEGSYAYYNRSARPGVLGIRVLLQNWFDRYPAPGQAELLGRFKADFDAAFFELFLHELCLTLTIAVEPHPQLASGTERRPDFRLLESGADSFLEARVARDQSDARRKEEMVRARLYDAINSLDVPDYFLHLERLELKSGKQPAIRPMIRDLQQWINSLEYEHLSVHRDDPVQRATMPVWTYEDDHLSIRVSVFPVSPSRRGAPDHRPIGMFPIESRWGGAVKSLKTALKRKGAKFGKFSVPYVIAVNSLSSWGFDRDEQLQALFGSEHILVDPTSREHKLGREPDGFWSGPRGPQHTRVSAVLFCQVSPWNVHQAQLGLYHNPWATFPYDGALTRLAQAVPQVPHMLWVDGASVGQLFGLSDGWLGED